MDKLKRMFSKKADLSESSLIAETIDNLTYSGNGNYPQHEDILVCADSINQFPDGPAVAYKTIKKHLKSYNAPVAANAIVVLDVLMRNCGNKFQNEVIQPEHLKSFEKLLARQDFHEENRRGLLAAIDVWEQTITDPKIKGVLTQFVKILISAGYNLPRQRSETFVPNATSEIQRESSIGNLNKPKDWFPTPPPDLPPEDAAQMGVPTVDMWKRKINNDILAFQNEVNMLSDLVSAVDPNEDIRKNELIQEFYHKCKDRSPNLVNLIPEVEDSIILEKLVKLNEELNRAFKAYDTQLERTELAFIQEISQAEFESLRKDNAALKFKPPVEELNVEQELQKAYDEQVQYQYEKNEFIELPPPESILSRSASQITFDPQNGVPVDSAPVQNDDPFRDPVDDEANEYQSHPSATSSGVDEEWIRTHPSSKKLGKMRA